MISTGRLVPRLPALRAREERLEALKRLIDHVAHDFNNLMVPVMGYSAMIRDDLGADSPLMSFATKLAQALSKTEKSVDQLLMAVRPQRRLDPQLGDLDQLTARVIAAWSRDVPGTAHVTVDAALSPCRLLFDESAWEGAIRHLLNNARHALATGGSIRVRLQRTVLDSERALDLGLPEEVYALTVGDEGVGMSSETLWRACDPLFTTRPRGQGIGLGLTWVHSVARLHGGQLWIESAEDSGTTVTIWLPMSQGIEASAEPAVSSGVVPRGKGSRRVLLVDDDPYVRESLKAYLQRHSLEVVVAQDGAEGWKTYQRQPRQFGVVVTDLAMPNMSGLELFRQIRTLDATIPVICISGDAGATEEAGRGAGPGSVARPFILQKPFPMRALGETVQQHMPTQA